MKRRDLQMNDLSVTVFRFQLFKINSNF